MTDTSEIRSAITRLDQLGAKLYMFLALLSGKYVEEAQGQVAEGMTHVVRRWHDDLFEVAQDLKAAIEEGAK